MVQEHNLDQTFVYATDSHEYRIKWARFGKTTGPPLIFIHGTPWSSAEWHDLAAGLSPHYNIYLYDHPGFDSSPSPKRLVDATDSDKIDLDGSLVLRAEASAALFKHWDLTTPPHVVAHDNGGLVALRLLLEHNLRYASLCLIDVVAMGPFGLPFFKLVAENESVFAAIPPNFTEGLIRAYVKSATFKPMPKEIEDMLSAPWLAGGTQGPGRFLKEMVQAHNRSTGVLEEGYSRIGGHVPTKIIWGKDDAWIPVATAERLHKALNAEELVVVEDAGHLIQYDQPIRLALEVGLWLGKHYGNGR